MLVAFLSLHRPMYSLEVEEDEEWDEQRNEGDDGANEYHVTDGKRTDGRIL